MALDIKAITTALANQIDTNTSRALACYELQPPTVPQFPCAIVRTGSPLVSYHETMGAGVGVLCQLALEVVVMATGVTDIDSQTVVMDLLSSGTGKTNSIIDAIEADRTLGGVVADCFVEQASGLTKAVSDTGTEAVVSTLTVTIRTRR